jgi:hypothetical protein
VKKCVEALSTPGTDDKPNPCTSRDGAKRSTTNLRDFAVSTGLDKDTVNTDRPRSLQAHPNGDDVQEGRDEGQTTKVNKTPKKIVKTSNSPVASQQSPNKAKQKKTMERLQRDRLSR